MVTFKWLRALRFAMSFDSAIETNWNEIFNKESSICKSLDILLGTRRDLSLSCTTVNRSRK